MYVPVESSAAPRIAPLCSILGVLGESIAANGLGSTRKSLRSMIDFSRNHFELFGLPERYRFDTASLDRAYRALQREVHPDRFARAGEAEQRLALQSSARVNEAYQALRDPVARAQYLLSLHGVEAFGETDTVLPFEFLERQLERREAAEEALRARNATQLGALADEVRADAQTLEQRLAARLDAEAAWDAARSDVRELRFLAKLAADIDEMQAEIEDASVD